MKNKTLKMSGSLICFSILFNVNNFVHAADATSCGTFQAKYDACITAAAPYVHGAWKLFQQKLCEANFFYTSYAEQAFCMVSKDLGISLANGTTTKTYNSKSIEVAIETPTESFATTAGYTSKMTIKVAGTTQTVVWWKGTDSSSAGYMIHNLSTSTAVYDGLSKPLSIYVQWDRTGTDQTVKYWGATYGNSTYLSYGTAPDNSTMGRFGYIKYDPTTKKVSDLQVVTQQNKLGSSTNVAACYRQRAWGYLGKTTEKLGTFNTNGSSPEQTNSTDLDGSSSTSEGANDNSQIGTGEIFPDDPAWPNATNSGTLTAPFTGTVTSGSGTVTGPGVYSKSCNDVLTTTLFSDATNKVTFTKTPAEAGF